MDAPRFLSGQFLLAMPGIGDPRFEKAVIAMCVHDEDGALGIGLGRIVPRIGFHDLLQQLDIDPGEAPNVADPSRRPGRAAARLHPPHARLGRRGERSTSATAGC